MAEWHIPPDYIMANWTYELFCLMCEKLADRKKRELEAIEGRGRSRGNVSDSELFTKANKIIKVVKK